MTHDDLDVQAYYDSHPEFRSRLAAAVEALDRGEGVELPEFSGGKYRVILSPQAAESWWQMQDGALESTHGSDS